MTCCLTFFGMSVQTIIMLNSCPCTNYAYMEDKQAVLILGVFFHIMSDSCRVLNTGRKDKPILYIKKTVNLPLA